MCDRGLQGRISERFSADEGTDFARFEKAPAALRALVLGVQEPGFDERRRGRHQRDKILRREAAPQLEITAEGDRLLQREPSATKGRVVANGQDLEQSALIALH